MNILRLLWTDWKRSYAVIVVYGYLYNIVLWGPLFWLTTLLTSWTSRQWPAPSLLPWEHLAAATGNLAVIGGLQFLRDRANMAPSKHEKGSGDA